jgi:hypothetical protein
MFCFTVHFVNQKWGRLSIVSVLIYVTHRNFLHYNALACKALVAVEFERRYIRW